MVRKFVECCLEQIPPRNIEWQPRYPCTNLGTQFASQGCPASASVSLSYCSKTNEPVQCGSLTRPLFFSPSSSPWENVRKQKDTISLWIVLFHIFHEEFRVREILPRESRDPRCISWRTCRQSRSSFSDCSHKLATCRSMNISSRPSTAVFKLSFSRLLV